MRSRADVGWVTLKAGETADLAAYQQLGQAKRSRNELEKLYAEAPEYEDVVHRLGLASD